VTYTAPVFELSVVGIFDAGVPHQERIVLRPSQAVDLSLFALIIGVNTDTGIVPVSDFFRWLGPATIAPPSWLVIYTDSGNDIETVDEKTAEPIYIKHWGKAHTLFINSPSQIILGVIKIGGLTTWIAPKPAKPMLGQ
jgi:hypothetical protein